MERLTEIKTHVTGFSYTDKKEGVFVQDVFAKLAAYEDTGLTPKQIQEQQRYIKALEKQVEVEGQQAIIEAQQQEINRLKKTLADWKYNAKCDADHIWAFISDKDEQAGRLMKMDYLLRRTLPILEVANDQQELIEQINELLGGKEDA